MIERSVARQIIMILLFLCATAAAGEPPTAIRIGYLDAPGSALMLLADAKGYFRAEQLQVTLVKFKQAGEGLAALEAGKIEVGAFPAADVLSAVSRGMELKVISGGGAPKADNPLAEADRTLPGPLQPKEILTVANATPSGIGKIVATRLVAALIRSHQYLQHNEPQAWRIIGKRLTQHPKAQTYSFDPNPDYYRLEPLWNGLGLQRPEMGRNHLAGHVHEEIYCDALDRIIVDSDLSDPVLQKLVRKAICVPNCCPANTGKLFANQKGVTQ